MRRWKDTSLEGPEKAKNMMKHPGTYTLLLLSLFAMVFFGMCQPGGGGSGGPSGVAAEVNGEEISRLEFRRAYENEAQRMKQRAPENFDPAAFQLAKRVLDQLVDQRLLYFVALDMGIKASEDDVYKQIAQMAEFKDEKGVFSETKFKEILQYYNYTERSFVDEQVRFLTLNKLNQFVMATDYASAKSVELDWRLAETKLDVDFIKIDPAQIAVTPTAADLAKYNDDAGKAKVKDYYDKHPTDYNEPAKVQARHILVAFKGARNASGDGAAREKDAAKKRAEEVLAKVKAAGSNFAALAKEFTDEPSGKARGGDLGKFTRDAMVKEFADAAFALKAGEVSGVVESPFGFHVIRVEGVFPAHNVTLAAATDGIVRNLIERERRPALATERAEKILKTLRENGSVDSLVREFGLKWESTGPFTLGTDSIPQLGSEKAVRDVVSTLRPDARIASKVVENRGVNFVLRLKSRTDADVKSLDADRRKQLAEMAAYYQGYAQMMAMERSLKDSTKSKNKIWFNPDYLALDRPRDRGDVAPGAGETDQGG